MEDSSNMMIKERSKEAYVLFLHQQLARKKIQLNWKKDLRSC